jgi:exodeoxyribonuclease V beta subunit
MCVSYVPRWPRRRSRLSWQELDCLNHDELAWEARVLQFRAYRDCWRRQGVLPMLRRLLNDFHLPARLLGQGRASDDGSRGSSEANKAINANNGERTLTNVLHLAELLQQASTLLDGEHALIRYLAEQQQDAASAGGDARQLRLESDADLVQVVTVHKSKGLEYPLVFLPFACNYRLTKGSDLPLKWHDEDGCLRLSLAADADIVERADGERLGEDLRKLYVALTRARYATWVGVAPLKELERSALAYLLGGGQAIAASALPQALQDWGDGCPDILVEPAPEPGNERFELNGVTPFVGAARQSQRVAGEHWWIASYSALKTEGESGAAPAAAAPAAETASEAVFQEAMVAQLAQLPLLALATQAGMPESGLSPLSGARTALPALAVASGLGSLHGFPRGAEAGTFLHDLLEAVARQGFATGAGDQALQRDMIARRCQARGWVHWIEPLTAWLQYFLNTPLRLNAMPGAPETSIRLSELNAAMAEMEFWLAVHSVPTTRIDALVCAHTLAGAARPALLPAQLNGMLKGFMDLVFEHQGRYYVADYKSNWLGPDDAAYTPVAMRAAILHARYELQYVLYLLALHRLLKSRLPDYDYDRHVGGAVYIFLRGVYAPSQGLHVERPPRALIEALDALFAGVVARGQEWPESGHECPQLRRPRANAGAVGELGSAAMAAPARYRLCRFPVARSARRAAVPDPRRCPGQPSAWAWPCLPRSRGDAESAGIRLVAAARRGQRRKQPGRGTRSATAAGRSPRRPEPQPVAASACAAAAGRCGAGNTPLVRRRRAPVPAPLLAVRAGRARRARAPAGNREQLQAALPIAALRQTLDLLFPPAAAAARH